MLRHHKEIGEHLGCSVGNVMRSKMNGSLLWAEQAGHKIEQGRLSGAVLAEEAYNAAGREVECDVVEHLS